MTNRRRWENGWVHCGPKIHACSPCLLWSFCTHQVSNGMVWTSIKSCLPFNYITIINEVFLLFSNYSEYCNMTKRRWENGWVHCGPQIHACSTCLIWSYFTHQLSIGIVLTVTESWYPFNVDLNEVFLIFKTILNNVV